ncbi:nicotinate-nucleotide--dimethylbenzimidazole phosphoribosyltransferase [Roseovarius atlanticus]|uniref:nicotinate-nucleotide--dimethylbenzimidazole phosphoribosyltransferase n=1 Tax=Roseovarius atlanticus TaxID=1641875 RepID=UPI001C9748F5|nr:nicotinate-nucleotide--dimethylbenzimidazole phosphoribosyltransferase [Roseovarius atlanticus]MBY5989936.1 nicotinate-nucleotide--dimethylbenzimidazole phosphoribosyltransferase [Roseovarius atlanticus]MBY6126481.1 nicotinate-nucleotide--dimethylbenzimidazole phosphoribosyltransferase [Roseovarius atlanticus]MBY6150975.1 nicotinate-nucleotide--dimethylbenzimidazole phosphoribosyltransferase [Roseovarius atlanticus]
MTILSDVSSLGEVAGLAGSLSVTDTDAAEAALARQNSLTKPPGALGRLEELAIFMAGWQGTDRPAISSAQALVFAGNHGVCAQGVNPFPQDVTAQMVANFEHGGAAINQLCRANGAELSVIALELDRPTADITAGPAMSEAETLDALRQGAAAVDPGVSVLILGEMGIGNSTIAAAMAKGAFGGDAAQWVGKGTGSDDAGVARKIDVVTRACACHSDARGLEILARLGGREQAAICGAVLEARARRMPVILDGFICTAATVPLFAADRRFLDHCLVGHVSREPGHARLLSELGMRPILSLDMALGEGSGAAIALGVLRSALACHNGMATFAEAGVSGQ